MGGCRSPRSYRYAARRFDQWNLPLLRWGPKITEINWTQKDLNKPWSLKPMFRKEEGGDASLDWGRVPFRGVEEQWQWCGCLNLSILIWQRRNKDFCQILLVSTRSIPTCGEGNAMLLSRVRWDGNRLLQLDQPSSRSLRWGCSGHFVSSLVWGWYFKKFKSVFH